MPSKVRERSPEGRKERKDDPKGDRSEQRHRHKSSSHRKSSAKEKNSSRTSISPVDTKRRSSMPGAIKEEDVPSSESKSSLPYPSFSKAHSKEAVGGQRPQLNILTPPATDLNASKDRLSTTKANPAVNGCPSPPLTDQNAGRWRSGGGKPVSVETIPEEDRKENRDSKVKIRLQPKNVRSNGHLRSTSDIGSKSSPTKAQARDRPGTPLKPTSPTTTTPQRSVSQPTRVISPPQVAAVTDAANDSDGTSIATEQPNIQRPGSKIPPAPIAETSSEVTSIHGQGQPNGHKSPMDVFIEQESPVSSATPASGAPPPPPPPPVVSVPRVDYLLQHGGLNQTIPKNLLLAGKPMAIQQAVASPTQPQIMTANLFEPYNQLLEDFNKVVSKNGSLAVATGYRSVARRLLDRLEAVFARDISSEECQCSMCERENQAGADVRGVSWGEVLELVSGRRDLPNWPPFSFVASPVGLGISLEMHAPMQKLDIDVPEEYREHFIRQSKKTKQSVDKWLNRQTDNTPTSPPEEVDDETLTFAILTHLPVEQRPIFKDLLGIIDRPMEPPKRAPSPDHDSMPKAPPTPLPRQRLHHIVTASEAIQRLYRLGSVPRDPETAIFLLNHPTLHNALATLAAISSDEWDILISGRFDGFLRSGADDLPDTLPVGRNKTGSRGNTPAYTNGHSRHNSASYSRTTTPAGPPPAQYGAPIAFDEETEIATLAEIERDIYTGMEILEDAFEALHLKAEAVRQALRDRGAGLAAAQQRRRGFGINGGGGVEVRLGTPASASGYGIGGDGKWETETDDGLGDWDGISELAPDDSASNISSSRRRRPKRRNERRTPALIEEDEEGGEYDGVSEGTESPRKR